MRRLFIFGLGYSATRIAAAARARGWEVIATGREGDLAFDDAGSVRLALADSAAVLSSVPPGGTAEDPVLAQYGDALGGKLLVYLSSTGVYGDCGGAWVDESAPTGGGRRTARAEADADWLGRGARVLRLPGIYGPGRSAFERIARGDARRIDVPGHVFSRVHVDDIARGAIAALEASGAQFAGAYNLADDLPASQNAVIEHACRLLCRAPPPLQTLDEAELSAPARQFYAEHRRVASGKARRLLGWSPRYRDYRAGLDALFAGDGDRRGS